MRKLALSDEILMQVEKPARYIGNELNSIVKEKNERHLNYAGSLNVTLYVIIKLLRCLWSLFRDMI